MAWSEPVIRLIDATPAQSMQQIVVHELEPLDTWSRAYVVLIGDAAHTPAPTWGQGACQALEDAWHLARCLDGRVDCLQEALQRFASLRARRAAELAEQGGMFARGLFDSDPEACPGAQ